MAKNKNKKSEDKKELNPLVNPNKPISEEQFKKIKKRHLIIEICLGILTLCVIAAMILILVLIKK